MVCNYKTETTLIWYIKINNKLTENPDNRGVTVHNINIPRDAFTRKCFFSSLEEGRQQNPPALSSHCFPLFSGVSFQNRADRGITEGEFCTH